MSFISLSKNTLCSVRKAGFFARSYIVPSLDHVNVNEGISGLYSPQGLANAWTDRVQQHTDNLNNLVDADAKERPILQLINDYSKSASKRNIVKNASMVYNLTFANNSLKASSEGSKYQLPLVNQKSTLIKDSVDIRLSYKNEPDKAMYEKLHMAILFSFGSLVEFRTLLLNSNLGISGDGFTWLVARKHQTRDYSADTLSTSTVKFDRLFVVNTYNAGTPFNFNKSNQLTDLKLLQEKPLESKDEKEKTKEDQQGQENDLSSVIDSHSYNKNTSYIPLLAIDASPKCWLHDYGVFGKEQYLNNVWESINWDVVESRMPELAQQYRVVI